MYDEACFNYLKEKETRQKRALLSSSSVLSQTVPIEFIMPAMSSRVPCRQFKACPKLRQKEGVYPFIPFYTSENPKKIMVIVTCEKIISPTDYTCLCSAILPHKANIQTDERYWNYLFIIVIVDCLGMYTSERKLKELGQYVLWGNLGGLSLTSVRVTLTVVDPESPPTWPAMSLAWMTTAYCSRASRSMFPKAVRITPATRGESWPLWDGDPSDRPGQSFVHLFSGLSFIYFYLVSWDILYIPLSTSFQNHNGTHRCTKLHFQNQMSTGGAEGKLRL